MDHAITSIADLINSETYYPTNFFDDLYLDVIIEHPTITSEPISNTPPTIITNLNLDLDKDSLEATITDTHLYTIDVESDATGLTYTITDNVKHGNIYRDYIELNNGSTFTQADINNGLITYSYDHSENFADSFEFSISDGIDIITEQSFNINIPPILDIPVATHNVTNHITRAVDYVEEDPTGNVYHVSITKGSNNGNGSQANPFLTIKQAMF
jgi:hypothetical protein